MCPSATALRTPELQQGEGVSPAPALETCGLLEGKERGGHCAQRDPWGTHAALSLYQSLSALRAGSIESGAPSSARVPSPGSPARGCPPLLTHPLPRDTFHACLFGSCPRGPALWGLTEKHKQPPCQPWARVHVPLRLLGQPVTRPVACCRPCLGFEPWLCPSQKLLNLPVPQSVICEMG